MSESFILLEECISSLELQIYNLASGQSLNQAYNAFYLPILRYFASEELQGVWKLFGGEIFGVKGSSLHCGDPWISHLIHVCLKYDLFIDVSTS